MLPHHIDRFQSNEWPALADALNKLVENVESLVPQAGRNLRMTVTAKGFTIDQNPAVEEGAASNFRGEWSQDNSYDAGESVKISNGVEAGTYVAVESVSAAPTPIGSWNDYPWLGGKWVLIGRVNDQSSWV